jgi:uncharacterized protein
MGKVILWIVVVFVVLFALRLLNVAKGRRENTERRRSARPEGETGAMVRCAACGVYLPRAEAAPAGEGYLCNDPQCVHARGGAR